MRPTHAELEGKIFDWDNPPPEGNPGMPIRCRCVAIPVIDLDKIVTKPVKNSYKQVHSEGTNVIIKEKDYVPPTDTLHEELAVVADNGIKNNLRINFELINTKEYHDKFEILSKHKAVNEALYKQAVTILEYKSGRPYEDIVVFDAKTGKKLAANNTAEFYKKTYRCWLTTKQKEDLQKLGKKFEILHNHPNNSLPSSSDIKGLFNRPLAVASTIVCHDGTIYRLEKLKALDNVDEVVSEAYRTARDVHPNWPKDAIENYVSEMLIELLKERKYIKFIVR